VFNRDKSSSWSPIQRCIMTTDDDRRSGLVEVVIGTLPSRRGVKMCGDADPVRAQSGSIQVVGSNHVPVSARF
jgi:hypothetical protein